MKRCQVCRAEAPADAHHCRCCGEASWAPSPAAPAVYVQLDLARVAALAAAAPTDAELEALTAPAAPSQPAAPPKMRGNR